MFRRITVYFLSFFLSLGILFSLCKQYLISYGNINVLIEYESIPNEDLTVYWNTGKGFSIEDFQTITTQKKEKEYNFTIKNLDTLTELRIDPDDEFYISCLKRVRITGTVKPIDINYFDKNSSVGMEFYQGNRMCCLKRIKNNKDPYLKIKIPVDSQLIKKDIAIIDVLLCLLCFGFAILLSIFLSPALIKLTLKYNSLKLVFFVCFVLTISSYFTNYFLKYYTPPVSIENRRLAKSPNYDSIIYQPKKFFLNFNNWFTDHFTYRQLLVHGNSYFRMKLFKTSPIPNAMYIGNNFEFFSGINSLNDDITGKRRLLNDEISFIYNNIRIKHSCLNDLKIGYYFTIPPTKQTVYEDLLPGYFRKQLKGKKIVEQLADVFTKNSIDYYINTVDLLKDWHKIRPADKLFYQFDVHWNEWGAFIAYQKLINTIRIKYPWVGKPLESTDVKMDTIYNDEADLSKLILLQKQYKKESYRIEPIIKDSITETSETGILDNPIVKCKNPKAFGRVLVYRDSYTEEWKNLIAHHFNESIFIWDPEIKLSQIIEYKPNIIIQENAEMLIFNLFKPIVLNEKK